MWNKKSSVLVLLACAALAAPKHSVAQEVNASYDRVLTQRSDHDEEGERKPDRRFEKRFDKKIKEGEEGFAREEVFLGSEGKPLRLKAGKRIEIVERDDQDDDGDRRSIKPRRRVEIERFEGPDGQRDVLIRRPPGPRSMYPRGPMMGGPMMMPFPGPPGAGGAEGRLQHLEEAIRHLRAGGFKEAAEKLQAQAEKMRESQQQGGPNLEQVRDLQKAQKELRSDLEHLRKELDRLREQLQRQGGGRGDDEGKHEKKREKEEK